jgi:uncharacterized protein (DUF697 family)
LLSDKVRAGGAVLASKARVLGQVWRALKELNPRNVEQEAARIVRIGVVGPIGVLQEVATFLLGDQPDAYDRAAERLLLIATPPEAGAFALLPKCDLVLVSDSYRDPLPDIAKKRIFGFSGRDDLPEVVKQVVKSRELDYAEISMARTFPAFRHEAAIKTIQTVSVENAVFVTSTALGNVIPNPLQPLTAVAESLGDLVVLTANQLRMLFRLAAMHERSLGAKEQAPEVLSILGAAFGWRSIARQLVSKIPFGGGVVPKAAIAFAGTWAVGESIAYYYSTGRRLSKEEVRQRFDAALDRGRGWAEQAVARLKMADEAFARFRDVCAARLAPGRDASETETTEEQHAE